jgi:tetratricopeptide (TPR) repeat protein
VKRLSWMVIAAATAGRLGGFVADAEACGPDLPDSSLRSVRWYDPDLGIRSPDDPDPDWRAERRWSAAGRALRELEPAVRYPKVADLTTREREEQEARGWFRGDEARVQAYLAFVSDPLTSAPPEGTPRAAVRYRRAVGAMHAGDLEHAVEGFGSVLELSPGAARPRVLWAHYMLANLEVGGRLAVSEHYERLRALVNAGTPDPLGLAFGSLRVDGLARQGWDDAGYVRLCHAYVQGGGQQNCGVASRSNDVERTSAALADRVFALDEAELSLAAADPWLASAVTAQQIYASAHSHRDADDDAREARWLDAVEANHAVLGDDLIGLASALAYQHGDWSRAARWSALGSTTDPRVADVRARLATRRGDPAGVIEALGSLEHLSRTHGDRLAVALLDTGQYQDAVRTYLRVGNWLDTAWIAERLLTASEVEALIADLPEGTRVEAPMSVWTWTYWDEPEADSGSHTSDIQASLWALLARRLAREGRWEQAVRAFDASAALTPEDHDQHRVAAAARPAAAAWARREEASTPAARAAATSDFFAALLPRRFDLLATEADPDFAMWGGSYDEYAVPPDQDDIGAWRLTTGQATADERSRQRASRDAMLAYARELGLGPEARAVGIALVGDVTHASAAFYDRRYHFLWTLAALAWASVEGLPQGDEQLVQLLCQGGSLLRNLDPQAAELFYKRLVVEGRPHPVAQVADARRWFPAVAYDGGPCVP